MELFKRSITGLLFVTILVFCIVAGPVWFACLFALCTIFSTLEFVSLINKNKEIQISKLWAVVASTSLFCAIFRSCIEYHYIYFLPFILSMIIIFVRELYKNESSPIINLSLVIMPIIYIALPFSLLSVLAFIPNKVEYNYVLPLTLFFLIWANDIGAYCIGCSLGKHKLFERISPKKTWEGFIGGASFSVITMILLYYFIPMWYSNMSIWIWIGMAFVIVLFGTWGDLIESMMKRELKVKDSGKVLPGHGGFLDRFDSTLLAIPATVIYFYIVLL